MSRRLRGLPPLVATPPGRVAGASASGTGFSRTDGLSSSARGYGADWRRVRAEVLRAEPHCRMCRGAGLLVPATDVDHIAPFHGLEDPRRLDRANLRPLCAPCHRTRTARQSHGHR